MIIKGLSCDSAGLHPDFGAILVGVSWPERGVNSNGIVPARWL